jgi:hypothetical protein
MATHLILQKIFKTGIVSEPAPEADLSLRTREQELHAEILKVFGQAVASAASMPAPATAANWRSTPSTAPTTTSRAWA